MSAADLLHVAGLRARRKELGLSREQLARAGGLATTALTRIERGQADALLTVEQLGRLADALGLTPAQLLQCTEDAPEAALTSDVARLSSLLLVADRFLSRDTAARALGWKLPRTLAAAEALERSASDLGVRLVTRGFKMRLDRVGGWQHTCSLATLEREEDVTRSTKARTARVIYNLFTNDADAATAPREVITEARAGALLGRESGAEGTLSHRTLNALQRLHQRRP